jgi:hypothetical protein
MKLWMSGEIGLGTLDTKNWREIKPGPYLDSP